MATQMGVIMGTAAYMSPEQARGSTVDRRADIWAFGVVLFEMLTGKQLFTGATISDTLAAVLRAEPDWNMLPGETPSALRRVLRRCLERDRKERLPHVGEARFLIREAQTTPSPETAAAEAVTAQPTGWQRVTPWVAGVVVGGVVVWLVVWNLSAPRPSTGTSLSVTITVPSEHWSTSPDGLATASPGWPATGQRFPPRRRKGRIDGLGSRRMGHRSPSRLRHTRPASQACGSVGPC